MPAEAVIKFTVDGLNAVVAKVKDLKSGLADAAAGPGGTFTKDQRARNMRAGKVAKAASMLSGIGGVGQLAEIASSAPTKALAAIGIAGVAAGVALKSFSAVVAHSTKRLEEGIRVTFNARSAIQGAASSANRSALSDVMGRRDEILSGPNATKAQYEFFNKMDSIQRLTDAASLERAMTFGEGVMRENLVAVKAPEAVAQSDLYKAAQEEIEIQREISQKMNFFQRFLRVFGNAAQGKGLNGDEIDAINKAAALAGDQR